MLLNEIKVLDKGFVGLFSSSNSGVKLKELSDEFFSASPHPLFGEMASATLVIKCPLFVQLKLSQYGFNIIQVPHKGEVEAFVPDITDVAAPDRQDAKAIADDLAKTTAALLINPKAYQADGCDTFVSQCAIPISVYTTLVVHGSLNRWIEYLESDDGAPEQVKQYNAAIKDLLKVEWKNFNAFKKLARGKYGKEN